MVAILQFPGTNCERDMHYAYSNILGAESVIVWHQEKALPASTSLVVIPGGFSYGDYLRSGAIARFAPIMQAVMAYAKNGGLVLGICNGFQILTESGLLPGALKRNQGLCFISKLQKLEVVSTDNRFLSSYQTGAVISLPIAHADGSYYADTDTLQSMKENNQILLQYVDNPNGSLECIAGVCNQEKNVFGLMPHPERFVEPLLGGTDGLAMLRSLL
ncbi:phosphoribosylformylglycinamidine synthase subunit PurQ [Helicobacter sp. 11S02596-1]|uniref:phosphoribosylformylglycinamidine synthase subunit PurQ n=1 Tax=Helicobacter sp. 11S02596-1 TaxID=1476194 RepID=UPI000BA6EA5A|nr:phosphoribosylformylglycinamidine synthase subunit PurQ [Helicobacter sp. 11S02596-1]PAF41625.1 phosphoribosylformylglycinamidine synthase I [Helicobacter sp. 11S02596-1]